MSAPTIKDVARAAGVSVATVSYVINDGPRAVLPDTRKRVEQAMRELGYEPNVSARRLRRQHNQVLALAVAGLSGLPAMSDFYFFDILRGVGVASDRHGYDLMLFGNQRKLQSSDFYRSLVRKRMVDGLIVAGSSLNFQAIAEVSGTDLPVVVVGRLHADVGLRQVLFNYEEDARRATELLIARGHRRIALLLNTLKLTGEQQRLTGYRRALLAAGLPFDERLVRIAPTIEPFPAPEVVRQVALEGGATAIVTGPYAEVCAYLAGLPGGAPVVVATLDEEWHIPRPPSLAVGVQLNKFEAGQQAVALLLQAIEGSQEVANEVIVPSTITEYPSAQISPLS